MERLGKLPKFTGLICGRTEIQTSCDLTLEATLVPITLVVSHNTDTRRCDVSLNALSKLSLVPVVKVMVYSFIHLFINSCIKLWAGSEGLMMK